MVSDFTKNLENDKVNANALTTNLKKVAQLCLLDHDFARDLISSPEIALEQAAIMLTETEKNTLNLYLLLFSASTSSIVYAKSGLFGGAIPDERGGGGGPWSFWPF